MTAGAGGGRQADVTTVADDEIVLHVSGGADGGGGVEVVRLAGLEPAAEYEVEGLTVRTLARPPGELLSRFATVNDVHFGETVCGHVADFGSLVEYLGGTAAGGGAGGGGAGEEAEEAARRAQEAFAQFGDSAVLTSADLPFVPAGGPTTYPELMSAEAAAEIAAIEPDAVLAKGDLTGRGTRAEYDAFVACYHGAFGDRLTHVRGNHDAMAGEELASGPRSVDVAGATLALLDTVTPGSDRGRLPADQVDWLDDLAAGTGGPVLVFGHHHAWNPSSRTRSPTYFGINPDDSEALVEVVRRRPRILGYFAGHTHRNRVRRFAATGDVPYVEVAATKDFPGSWAEYRVYEGGVLQVHRRTSTPAALAWSERCRSLYWGLYPRYAFGSLDDRCFAIVPRA